MNYENSTPIYLQLEQKIKIEIISGRIPPGSRLPSVRNFAIDLKVNPNTLQRALQELEEENLIFTERTNGKFVTNDKKIIDIHLKRYAKRLTEEYKAKMKEIGL